MASVAGSVRPKSKNLPKTGGLRPWKKPLGLPTSRFGCLQHLSRPPRVPVFVQRVYEPGTGLENEFTNLGRDWRGRDWRDGTGGPGLDGTGRDWTGLDGTGRNWTELDWTGRDGTRGTRGLGDSGTRGLGDSATLVCDPTPAILRFPTCSITRGSFTQCEDFTYPFWRC
jgi:hypothetical protein